MTEIKTYCDHCGKVLNDRFDYVDTEIEALSWFKCDLCKDCINELERIVTRFCNKGGK